MYRFHDFTKELAADFWRNYYEDPGLIDIFSFANGVLGAPISYGIMQHYDIQAINNHLPGKMDVWVELKLGEPVQGSEKYPYRYEIPRDILYIDTLHERMVDPEEFYQVNVDFIFYPGRLEFGKQPKSTTLLAPKISRVGTRLHDDFGKAFGYARFDSYYYRDTMIPLMELMYRGPTYNLIKTAGNVMVANPIAKYGGDVPVNGTIRVVLKERDDVEIPFGSIFSEGGSIYTSTREIIVHSVDLPDGLYVDVPVQSVGAGKEYNARANDPVNAVSPQNVDRAFFLTATTDGGQGETVIEITDEWVRTDKYRYPHGAAPPTVKVGDKLSRNQQLAEVVELFTHKTHPNWWVHRAPELFYKYSETALDNDQKNLMMSRYLKSFVANLQVKYHQVDWSKFQFHRDVFELILDGMPIRSDLILSGAYEVNDPGVYPEQDSLRTVPHNFCLWSNRVVPGAEGFIHPPTEFFPRLDEETWKLGTNRFFFIHEGEEYKEFWSSEPEVYPYVEPYICDLKVEVKETSTYSALWKRVSELELDIAYPNDKQKGARTGMLSRISSESVPSDKGGQTKSILASQMIEKILLSTWSMNGTHIGVDGLVCNADSNGYAVSPEFDLGKFPKNVQLQLFKETPEGTSVSLEVSLNDGDWVPLPQEGLVGVSGLLRVKALLQASQYEWPVFKGMNVTVQLTEEA